jgi:hypothetical protein
MGIPVVGGGMRNIGSMGPELGVEPGEGDRIGDLPPPPVAEPEVRVVMEGPAPDREIVASFSPS